MAMRRRCDNHHCRKVTSISSRSDSNIEIANQLSSDTVAPTLVFIFYELGLNSDHQEKLCEELISINVHDPVALRSLPHLNGVINESLRIHPPVPTGGYRQSPKGGMKVGDKHIPGNITIVAPRYTLGRRKRPIASTSWYELISKQSKLASSRLRNSFPSGGTASGT